MFDFEDRVTIDGDAVYAGHEDMNQYAKARLAELYGLDNDTLLCMAALLCARGGGAPHAARQRPVPPALKVQRRPRKRLRWHAATLPGLKVPIPTA